MKMNELPAILSFYLISISSNAVSSTRTYINCQEHPLLNVSYWASKELTQAKRVEMTHCDIPNISFLTLFKHLNISTSDVEELVIIGNDTLPRLSITHFTGLPLKSLEVRSIGNSRNPDENFLEPPASLINPTLRNVWRPLPANTRIRRSNMVLSSSSPEDSIKDCKDLESAEFIRWNRPEDGWLMHCPKLRSISVQMLTKTDLVRMMTGLHLLTYLEIKFCKLTSLSGNIFKDAIGLTTLIIQKNSIRVVERDAFEHQANLEYLDLSYNDLTNPGDIIDALAPLHSLRKLILDYNKNFRICDLLETSPPAAPIEYLSLVETMPNILCFGSWDKLQYLDMNLSGTLEFNGLPRSTEHDVVVKLRGNIVSMPDTREGYEVMTENFADVKNLTVDVIKVVQCDCRLGWLARALRELPNVHVRGLTCTNNDDALQAQAIEYIECDKYWVDMCIHRRSWKDNSVNADCRNKQKHHISPIENLRTLDASSNSIQTLDIADIPDTLLLADFSYNAISRLSENVTKKIFSVPERRILFFGNPIICDCNNTDFLKTLQAHNVQISDYENITCVNDGRKLKDIIPDDLCLETSEPFNPIILVAPAVVSCILILCIFLYRRFSFQLKVFLYSRGCCMSCLREEDLDADRVFDAFISFCHWDDEFVHDNILSELSDYVLCIHYRDWVLGEWIPSQIALSVKHSKRTILILSRKFLASSWGMMEFRMAHASMLKEGQRRLIAIVLDDVLDEPDMDAELRGYLSSNTYIKWGDPWFSQKLRYALPHKNGQVDNITEAGINSDDFRIAVENYRTGVYQIVPPEHETINNLRPNNDSEILQNMHADYMVALNCNLENNEGISDDPEAINLHSLNQASYDSYGTFATPNVPPIN